MSGAATDETTARGLQLLQQGRFAEARRFLEDYCRERPEAANGWFLLGAACHGMGDLSAALNAIETSLRLSPGFVQALSARGAVELALDRHTAALATYRSALDLAPHDQQLWTNAGIVLGAMNDWPGALQDYDAALARDPTFAPALMNRGLALSKLGRAEEALANNERFVASHAELAEAHYNHAETLLALSRFGAALTAADKALGLAPRHAGAHFDRGLALACMGRFEAANAAFESSRTSDPKRFLTLSRSGGLALAGDRGLDARALYLLRLLAAQEACDWRDREALVSQFESLVQSTEEARRPLDTPELLFSSLALPLAGGTYLTLGRSVAAGFASRVPRGGAAAPIRAPGGTSATACRIRVGYCSPDFRMHPVGWLTQGLYGCHDRSRFEVLAYSLQSDDGSDVRKRIVSSVDRFVDLSGLSDEATARRIAEDDIDVLIDLAGYTELGRGGVFARRPASVQVNYLGYAGSLGANHMDYAIVDDVLCPDGADSLWTEKLVRLPAFSPCGSNEVPAHLVRQRGEMGLPESGFVFCCFVNNYKIDPSIFDAWMAILAKVPGACLWLTQSRPATPVNLRREARARGVEPERLVFAPRASFPAYLARYSSADLFLDTRWFNAHTTAIDALRAGVPVLTIAGATMASRLGASVLQAAGLSELIVDSLDDYVLRATELARNPPALQELRVKLRTTVRSSTLFDTEARARELEAAYTEMVARHRRGLEPAAFRVQAKPSTPTWF